jgi:hypothetical protein
MEREGSLPFSQDPTAVPYPEPDEWSPHSQTLFINDETQLHLQFYS